MEPPFELGLLNGQQDFPESGSRDKTHIFEIIARDQLWGIHFFGWSFRQEPLDEVVSFKPPVTCQTIQAVQFQVFFKSRQAHKSLERRGAHLRNVFEAEVI